MGKSYEDINDRLKREIRACGLPMPKLAEQAGINKSQLSYYLNGHRSLTLDSAAKICRTLGLELCKVRTKKG